jgi:hypothetical protein
MCCRIDPYVGSDFKYALCHLMSGWRMIVVVNHKTSSIPKGSTLTGEQVGQGTGRYFTICIVWYISYKGNRNFPLILMNVITLFRKHWGRRLLNRLITNIPRFRSARNFYVTVILIFSVFLNVWTTHLCRWFIRYLYVMILHFIDERWTCRFSCIHFCTTHLTSNKQRFRVRLLSFF